MLNKKQCMNIAFTSLIVSGFIGCSNEPQLPVDSIKKADQLVAEKHYLEAIKRYEKLLKIVPNNKELQQKLNSAKDLYVDLMLNNIKRTFNSRPLHSLQAIKNSIEQSAKLELYMTKNTKSNYNDVKILLHSEENIVKNKISKFKDNINNSILSNNYSKIINNLIDLKKYNEDSINSSFYKSTLEKVDVYYINLITKLLDNDKLEDAKKIQHKYLNYNLNKNVEVILKNKIEDYLKVYNLINNSYQLILESRLEEVLNNVIELNEYKLTNKSLKQRLKKLNKKVTKEYINLVMNYINDNNIADAYSTLKQVMILNKNIKYTKTAKIVLENLYIKAKKYSKSGFIGNAYAIYTYIQEIDNNYKSTFILHRDLKDILKRNNIFKLATSEFVIAGNEKNAGARFTASLSSQLFRTKPKDIKVIERNRLKSILDELKLRDTGNLESLAQRGKIKGIDAFIFGDVIESSVDLQRRESTEQTMVQIGTRKINNNQFMLYMMSSDMDKKRWKNIPKEFIEEPVTQLVSYRKGKIKKTANLIISIRIVDITRGDIIAAKTFEDTIVVEDKYNDGVQLANIQNDPEDIASDRTILNELQNKMTAKLSEFILSQFKNRVQVQLDKADLYTSRREYDKAMEHVINAEIINMIKGVNNSETIKEIKYKLFKEILK